MSLLCCFRGMIMRIGSNDVVASLGLAIFDPAGDKSFHEVFKRADGLMYERKMQLKSMGAVTRN